MKEICQFCQKEILIKTKESMRGHLSSCQKYHEAINKCLSKKFFEEMYIEKGLSVNKIRKILKKEKNLSVTANQMEKKLKEYDIHIRNVLESVKMDDRQNEIKKTCLEKYGDINVLGKKSPKFEKRNKTVFEKYGVKNVFQSNEVKEKIKNTCLEKYGFESHMKNKEMQKKIMQIFYEKYGTTMPILSGRHFTKPHKIINDLLNKHNISFQNEYYIGNENIHVDIFIPTYKIVIEIYGDFWHANPKKYKKDDILNMPKGRTNLVESIWKHDKIRIQKIQQFLSPNKILIFWENEINNELSTIEVKLLNTIKEIKNGNCKNC